jgi:N-methylhydantoinase B/oxoprolinase/acetone carboxylase alpha subunit
MSIDDAIKDMQAQISALSGGVQMKVVKMSDEEARITVMAPAGDIQKIKDAMFKPALDLLNNEGFDIQIQVYDKDAPPLSA